MTTNQNGSSAADLTGRVAIMLDRERFLRFDFLSLALLRDELGDDYLAQLYERLDSGNLRLKSWRVLITFIWAGLAGDCEDFKRVMSEREVARLINLKKAHVYDLLASVVSALHACFSGWDPSEGNALGAKGEKEGGSESGSTGEKSSKKPGGSPLAN